MLYHNLAAGPAGTAYFAFQRMYGHFCKPGVAAGNGLA